MLHPTPVPAFPKGRISSNRGQFSSSFVCEVLPGPEAVTGTDPAPSRVGPKATYVRPPLPGARPPDPHGKHRPADHRGIPGQGVADRSEACPPSLSAPSGILEGPQVRGWATNHLPDPVPGSPRQTCSSFKSRPRPFSRRELQRFRTRERPAPFLMALATPPTSGWHGFGSAEAGGSGLGWRGRWGVRPGGVFPAGGTGVNYLGSLEWW